MIGHRIAQLRKLNKMSQYDLGKEVNLDQTLISRIERNQRKVTSDELVLFSKVLNVSINELLKTSRSIQQGTNIQGLLEIVAVGKD